MTVAEIVRAVEGPNAPRAVDPPEDIEYRASPEYLQAVWIAVRASLRNVLEEVTLADLVSGELPDVVGELTSATDAWVGLDAMFSQGRGFEPLAYPNAEQIWRRRAGCS